MTKSAKIVTILVVALMVLSMGISAYASGTSSPAGLIDGMKPSDYSDDSGISGIIQNIVKVVNIVGVGIAIIILLILGIKYMIGSAEEKADYKKSMIPYLVGAVLIFAGTSIVNVIVQLATSVGSSTDSVG